MKRKIDKNNKNWVDMISCMLYLYADIILVNRSECIYVWNSKICDYWPNF